MRRCFFIGIVLLVGCGPAEPTWEWELLPAGFPTPFVPADNPMSEAKVELGRRLFYDPALSGNETQSCASCHAQNLAFTDGLEVSTGSTGDLTPRSSMSLANIAYAPRLTWAHPDLSRLDAQARIPLFGTDPVEMGADEAALVTRLEEDPTYPLLFAEAFPNSDTPISVDHAVKAIASFERTLLSGDSAYDRFIYQGDDTALSDAARRGLELFNSERLECFHCHGGFNFSDGVRHDGTQIEEVGFHNTGLYNVDGRGGYPAPNRGLLEITEARADMGRFRSPTLRNIALTAPYMHDGSIATLDEVLDHYAAGGRTLADGPNAGVGSESPLKNIFIHGFTLSEEERADMLAFLESLTDEAFLEEPRFADPFAGE
ncbi:MAG: MbnH family di-heme enzyme [Sandaracinaceae bacterium]